MVIRLILIYIMLFSSCKIWAQDSFYKGYKRGWHWFEEMQRTKKQDVDNQSELSPETIVKNFAKTLDDARYKMMAYPTRANVTEYMKLEEKMWKRAFELYDTYEMSKFIDPDGLGVTQGNVQSIRLDREEEYKKIQININKLAQKFDLVLFMTSNCNYSKAFDPIIRRFAQSYNFKLDLVDINDKKSSYLVKKLNIDSVPKLIAVHKNRPVTVAISSGYLSYKEIEDGFNMMWKYLNEDYKDLGI